MNSTYNPPLVLMSLLVAMLASFAALDLTARLASPAHDVRRSRWLFGGALSMGVGIWSMHFIGMLAFELPIRVGYSFGITLASLLVSVAASYLALRVVSVSLLSRRRLIIGGILSVLFGIGVLLVPGAGALALVWVIAAYAIVEGILFVALAFRLKKHVHA